MRRSGIKSPGLIRVLDRHVGGHQWARLPAERRLRAGDAAFPGLAEPSELPVHGPAAWPALRPDHRVPIVCPADCSDVPEVAIRPNKATVMILFISRECVVWLSEKEVA